MKVSYDKDEDILMLVLSNKKTDDSYETDSGIVSVTDDGEPVIIEIFNATNLLKDINKNLPVKVKRDIFTDQPAITHQIKR